MIAFANQMTKLPQRPPQSFPEPLFSIKQTVAVPTTVAESKLARVCGCEWGPANSRVKVKAVGWLYSLVFIPLNGLPENDRLGMIPSGEAYLASEEELLAWQSARAIQ